MIADASQRKINLSLVITILNSEKMNFVSDLRIKIDQAINILKSAEDSGLACQECIDRLLFPGPEKISADPKIQ